MRYREVGWCRKLARHVAPQFAVFASAVAVSGSGANIHPGISRDADVP